MSSKHKSKKRKKEKKKERKQKRKKTKKKRKKNKSFFSSKQTQKRSSSSESTIIDSMSSSKNYTETTSSSLSSSSRSSSSSSCSSMSSYSSKKQGKKAYHRSLSTSSTSSSSYSLSSHDLQYSTESSSEEKKPSRLTNHIVEIKSKKKKKNAFSKIGRLKRKDVKERVSLLKQNSKSRLEYSIDVCFLMDTTNSMQRYLEKVNTKIKEILSWFKVNYQEHKIRFSFVSYKDIEHSDRVQSFDFVEKTKLEKFCKFLENLEFKSGDDWAEDVLAGLETALRLNWKSQCKIMIHFGDAPCHGRKFHKEKITDNYPDGIPKQRRAKGILKDFKLRGIDYFFGKITNNTDKMVSQFRKYYDCVGDFRKIFEFLAETNSDNFAKKIQNCINESFQNSRRRLENFGYSINANNEKYQKQTIKGKEQRKKHNKQQLWHNGDKRMKTNLMNNTNYHNSFEKTRNDHYNKVYNDQRKFNRHNPNIRKGKNNYYKPERAIIYRVDPQTTLEQIISGETINYIDEETTVRISKDIIGVGTFRTCYHMIDIINGDNLVAKNYIHSKRNEKKETCKTAVVIQYIAKLLSKEFNAKGPYRSVDFLESFAYYFPNRKKYKWMNAEPYIKGKYIKYSNNGRWNLGPDRFATAQAFSHFTHEFTRGKLIVVDLQGVNYIFTDPAIHSAGKRTFNNTDLGKQGIKAFFKGHQCSNICKKVLDLKTTNKHQKIVQSSTTFKKMKFFELVCSNPFCGNKVDVLRRTYHKKKSFYCGDCLDNIRNSKK
ncbi:alpha-protein kinase vwka [Anaeramoeba flamelloides]|uniref:Alpha-protein kinase vwka n=1 Tax=Anaeramoeba flamelloides TaxID=1746091 RepID=A0AAV7YM45_9EUKA|nr:alpha-protein kinase vwka [Anaeramoeba flamelloides]